MARVLVIDDDADALPVRRSILERAGHAVEIAASLKEARERFAADPPDTVVMDLRLPRAEDGLALIREWRAAAPDLRIVVLSGRTTELEMSGERSLVDEVLRKPVRSERLLQVLSTPLRAFGKGG